jgi:PAS domain S-box-containing protein
MNASSGKPLPKILIIEDEMIVALDLQRCLRKLGFDPCGIAPAGEEAIARAEALEPDLALVDIHLQGEMDGIAAAEGIRLKHDIPIVYLTANADDQTLRRAKLTQPASYLLKPFRERELQICIEMALINHSLQRQLREYHGELEHRVHDRTADLVAANVALQEEIRKSAQAQAKIAQQAALLDEAQDAIMVQDLAGHVTYWNRSAEQLYGYSRDEAVAGGTDRLEADHDDLTSARALQETLASGTWIGELRQRSTAGADLTVESRWTLVRDDRARPQSILVVNTDISERKKIEAQFLRAQRLESIGALASGIAHDLNNVFSPVMMATELLGETIHDPHHRHVLDVISQASRRGAAMVRQVLTFARGTDGERIPVSMRHLATEVERLITDTFPRSISIRCQYGKDTPTVFGDPTQLHQVLMNLCVNARDAMPEGGNLTIGVGVAQVDSDLAKRHEPAAPGRYAVLTVSDTGSGMPPEVCRKIFEPFFTTKELGKGTGLGLSTVLSIARNHHGFVDFETAVGAGTAFKVYLPLLAEEEAEGKAAKAPAPPLGHGECILLVEDERAMKEITKTALENYGYRVLTADNGAEAISIYARNPQTIDLVVTDLAMPLVDGRVMIRVLRQMNPKVRLLVISGTDSASAAYASAESDQAPFLAKPFTKESLLTALHRELHVTNSLPQDAYAI